MTTNQEQDWLKKIQAEWADGLGDPFLTDETIEALAPLVTAHIQTTVLAVIGEDEPTGDTAAQVYHNDLRAEQRLRLAQLLDRGEK